MQFLLKITIYLTFNSSNQYKNTPTHIYPCKKDKITKKYKIKFEERMKRNISYSIQILFSYRIFLYIFYFYKKYSQNLLFFNRNLTWIFIIIIILQNIYFTPTGYMTKKTFRMFMKQLYRKFVFHSVDIWFRQTSVFMRENHFHKFPGIFCRDLREFFIIKF